MSVASHCRHHRGRSSAASTAGRPARGQRGTDRGPPLLAPRRHPRVRYRASRRPVRPFPV